MKLDPKPLCVALLMANVLNVPHLFAATTESTNILIADESGATAPAAGTILQTVQFITPGQFNLLSQAQMAQKRYGIDLTTTNAKLLSTLKLDPVKVALMHGIKISTQYQLSEYPENIRAAIAQENMPLVITTPAGSETPSDVFNGLPVGADWLNIAVTGPGSIGSNFVNAAASHALRFAVDTKLAPLSFANSDLSNLGMLELINPALLIGLTDQDYQAINTQVPFVKGSQQLITNITSQPPVIKLRIYEITDKGDDNATLAKTILGQNPSAVVVIPANSIDPTDAVEQKLSLRTLGNDKVVLFGANLSLLDRIMITQSLFRAPSVVMSPDGKTAQVDLIQMFALQGALQKEGYPHVDQMLAFHQQTLANRLEAINPAQLLLVAHITATNGPALTTTIQNLIAPLSRQLKLTIMLVPGSAQEKDVPYAAQFIQTTVSMLKQKQINYTFNLGEYTEQARPEIIQGAHLTPGETANATPKEATQILDAQSDNLQKITQALNKHRGPVIVKHFNSLNASTQRTLLGHSPSNQNVTSDYDANSGTYSQTPDYNDQILAGTDEIKSIMRQEAQTSSS